MELYCPNGIAVDADQNIYVSNYDNSSISTPRTRRATFPREQREWEYAADPCDHLQKDKVNIP
jgi:NHL repeat